MSALRPLQLLPPFCIWIHLLRSLSSPSSPLAHIRTFSQLSFASLSSVLYAFLLFFLFSVPTCPQHCDGQEGSLFLRSPSRFQSRPFTQNCSASLTFWFDPPLLFYLDRHSSDVPHENFSTFISSNIQLYSCTCSRVRSGCIQL